MPDVPAIKPEPTPIPRDIIKLIATDIGKEVASHIEIMYPGAVKNTSSTFLLSVRSCIHNQIMGALENTDEAAILNWLDDRKRHRRKLRAAYRRIRDRPVTDDVLSDD